MAGFKSQYRSSKSVAKNKTVPISVDDPRLAPDKIAQTRARQGAEIEIIGLDGKSLIGGGTRSVSPSGSTGTASQAGYNKNIVMPGANGQLPYEVTYGVITPTDPTDVTAVWSGNDLVVSFNWDYANPLNQSVSNFILEMLVDGVTVRTPLETFVPNKTQTAQTLTLTELLNIKTFNVFTTNITSIAVIAIDPFYNTSNSVAVASVPTYAFTLSAPVITVSAIVSGYSVAYTPPTDPSYGSIEIVEYESSSSTEPTGVTYSRVYFGTISPANIIAGNTNARWVKARFIGKSGTNFTSFCAAQKVTPTSPVSVDNTPPNEVSSVTGVWDADNVVVTYALPSTDPAVRVQIQLTAPNNLVGYFYRFPAGSGSQTTTITKKDLFDQFGEHYSSFTGILRSIDAADNKSSGVSFTVASRANPLAGVTPTFSTVALSNAYSVNFTLPIGAAYAEVYAKHTAWSGDPVDDEFVVYAGLSPAVVTDTDYTPVYIKIRYYDDFNNTSNYSAEGVTEPLNPGEITSFENPISFGENAVIYAGVSPTTGTRTLFKAGGIFAYDSVNTAPSTQIVSDAADGTPTFITTQAQIADWKISDTKIENTLSGTPSKYVGLSASGTYSFWAGSDVTGGDDEANFSVTPGGAVRAKNILITGNGTSSNLMNIAGLFIVKNDGSVTATSATITGNITASSGSFTGNVSVGATGSLYSGTLSGNNLSGAGYILNTTGIIFNSSSVNGITSISGSTGKLITKSAEIGNWSVDENRIYKTSAGGQGNLSLDSANGYIYVSSDNIASYTAGINSASSQSSVAFWAGTAKQTIGGIDYPNPGKQTGGIYDNNFVVTMGGNLYARDVNITGTVTATDGYIGSSTEGWTIAPSSITASDGATIIMGTQGKITLGSYSIFANSGGFKLFDGTGNVMSISDVAGTTDPGRLLLGQAPASGVTARQVEVAKDAQISGSYSGGTTEDYRSGGLRNMYTITEYQFSLYPTPFQNAQKGAVLLVYKP